MPDDQTFNSFDFSGGNSWLDNKKDDTIEKGENKGTNNQTKNSWEKN